MSYTINGKKIEIVVKKVVSGLCVVASSMVANPGPRGYHDIEQFMRPLKT